jgi:hypothetical protein
MGLSNDITLSPTPTDDFVLTQFPMPMDDFISTPESTIVIPLTENPIQSERSNRRRPSSPTVQANVNNNINNDFKKNTKVFTAPMTIDFMQSRHLFVPTKNPSSVYINGISISCTF